MDDSRPETSNPGLTKSEGQGQSRMMSAAQRPSSRRRFGEAMTARQVHINVSQSPCKLCSLETEGRCLTLSLAFIYICHPETRQPNGSSPKRISTTTWESNDSTPVCHATWFVIQTRICSPDCDS